MHQTRIAGGGQALATVALALTLAWFVPGLDAQDVDWPRPGTRVRVTSQPGPPSAVVSALRELGLEEGAPRSVLRVAPDGRARFTGFWAGHGADSFRMRRAADGPAAELRMTDVISLERVVGRNSHTRGGFMLGAVVGAGLGLGFVSAIGEDPGAGNFVEGAALVAIPGGLLGALIGRLISSDAWASFYLRGDR